MTPTKPALSGLHTGFLACVMLGPSQALSPFPFLLACFLMLVIVAKRSGMMKASHIAASLVMLGLALVGMVLEFQPASALRALMVCALLPLVGSIDLTRQQRSLDAISRLLAFSIVLSIIGFFYALVGGQPLLSLANPDGREAMLFLTTLSNAIFPAGGGYVIRPSFVFDEPGAYAFVIDAFLLLNFLVYRKLRRLDYFIMIGGLCTFSLAHIAVSVLLLCAARRTPVLILPALALVIGDYMLYKLTDISLILDRFAFEGGTIAGDNRSELMSNALQLLQHYPGGVGGRCEWDMAWCLDKFDGFGENPLFPAAFYGILASSAYYIVLATTAVAGVLSFSRWHACTALAVVLLIAQRPFLFSIGYNLQILLLFALVLRQAPIFLVSRRSLKHVA